MMAAVAAFLWIPAYVWHPLHGNGYQFWSGIGSDFAELTIATSIVAWLVSSYRQRNCHVKRCWRLAWHHDPGHGHPVCRRHHPHAGRCVPDPAGGSMILDDE